VPASNDDREILSNSFSLFAGGLKKGTGDPDITNLLVFHRKFQLTEFPRAA
jgi:hypothetical protein